MASERGRSLRGLALAIGASFAGYALAAEEPPAFGRYVPMYPATYVTLDELRDDRDASFDQSGAEHATAMPTVPGTTSFPERRYEAAFSWYFPLLEDAGLPFVSSRLHMARLIFRYGESHTDGALSAYVASNPEFAPQNEPGQRGIGDVGLQFGVFLAGGADWRTRKESPFALLLLGAMEMPVGAYEQTSPVTQGSNRVAYGATLGAHWRPWRGGFVEAGTGVRAYGDNKNANFGRMAPGQQGTDRLANLSLTQRLFSGAYVGAFATDRKGRPNAYRDPRYAANAPTPDPAPSGGTTESYPIPGTYHDDGTALRVAGLSFSYFLTQSLLFGFDWSHPLSGRSGQPDVAFRQRQCQAGSAPGSGGCTETDFPGTTRVDGLGSARSYSSDAFRISLSWNFGHADPFACTGCGP